MTVEDEGVPEKGKGVREEEDPPGDSRKEWGDINS